MTTKQKHERIEELEASFCDASSSSDCGVDGNNYNAMLTDCAEYKALCWGLRKELPDNNPGYCAVLAQASYVEECFEDMVAEEEDED